MPFIPPSLFSPDSYLAQGPAQSTFNISLPSIDIPEMPSLPSGDSVIGFFRALYQAIVSFFAQVPADHFAKEHPEDVKIGGIVLLLLVAAIGVWFALPALLSVFAAIGTGLAVVGKAVMMGVARILVAIKQLFLWLAAGVLSLAGFTAQGIAAGSAAASVQSVVYGAFTRGVFSVLQSLGVIIGRLALAVA